MRKSSTKPLRRHRKCLQKKVITITDLEMRMLIEAALAEFNKL
ncbi:MAG: hypothetical protein PUB42_00120 [Firmicutes bacterium]|nr:hypothetical protein [Bacillota bacterium]